MRVALHIVLPSSPCPGSAPGYPASYDPVVESTFGAGGRSGLTPQVVDDIVAIGRSDTIVLAAESGYSCWGCGSGGCSCCCGARACAGYALRIIYAKYIVRELANLTKTYLMETKVKE